MLIKRKFYEFTLKTIFLIPLLSLANEGIDYESDQLIAADFHNEDCCVDMPFIAITPCRIVDTRFAGGKFSVNETRKFILQNSRHQGGNPNGCPIAQAIRGISTFSGSLVKGVMLNITSTQGESNGFISVFPSDSPRPNASVLNYQSSDISNAVVTKASDFFIGSTMIQSEIAIFASAPTHLIIDVLGYYPLQLNPQGALRSQGVLKSAEINSNGELTNCVNTQCSTDNSKTRRVSIGVYELAFFPPNNISDLPITVSCKGRMGVSCTQISSEVLSLGSENRVRVYTYDRFGNPIDSSFTLVIH